MGNAADPLETRPSPTWVTVPSFIACGQMVQDTCRDLPEKMGAKRRTFQGHQGDINRSGTYNLLLEIRSNHDRILYHFRDKRR